MMRNANDCIGAISEAIYPDLSINYTDPKYLRERAILGPRNNDVTELKNYTLNQLPCEKKTYFSSDYLCKRSGSRNDEGLPYSTEFLNSLLFSGIADHLLTLCIGAFVMLLRNPNQTAGQCNGTRLIITKLGNWHVQARINSGLMLGILS